MNGIGKNLVAIVAVVIFGGCTGSGAPSPNPSSPSPPPTASPTISPTVVGTLTLTGFFDEMSAKLRPVCTLDEEAAAIGVGRVLLNVVNETDGGATVGMWSIAEGHTYRELRAHLAGEQETPRWVGEVMSVTLGPGESAAEEGTVHPGTHAIACIWDDGQAPAPTGIALVGPVEVE